MAKKNIQLKIGGMECPNCAMILEMIEDKLAGVSRAEASYHKSSLTIEFDDATTTEAEIQREVNRLGYQVLEINPARR